MKAVVTTGEKRKVVVEEVPNVQVQPGTLLIKIKYAGICGSDLEYLDGLSRELQAGVSFGHEFSGEVAEVGEGVEGWSVGDRVCYSGDTRQPCGRCYFCRRRLYHLCAGMRATPATPDDKARRQASRYGAFAEYLVRPPIFYQEVPDSVSDEEAALCEPLSVGLRAVQIAEIKPGDTAVVIGAGRIGLGAMLFAKVAGASPVIVVTSRTQSRLDKAVEMGADAVLNDSEVDVVSEVGKLTGGIGPDAILNCTRRGALQGKLLNQIVDMVRRGGIIVLAAGAPTTEISSGIWLGKNLTMVGFVGSTPTATVMHLIEHKQVNVKPIISEIIPFEEAQRAFDSQYSGENIAALLKP